MGRSRRQERSARINLPVLARWWRIVRNAGWAALFMGAGCASSSVLPGSPSNTRLWGWPHGTALRATLQVKGDRIRAAGTEEWDGAAEMLWRVYATDRELGLDQEALRDWSGEPAPLWDRQIQAIVYWPSFRFSPGNWKLTKVEGGDIFRQRLTVLIARVYGPERVSEWTQELEGLARWQDALLFFPREIDSTLVNSHKDDGHDVSTVPLKTSLGGAVVENRVTEERRRVPCPGRNTLGCRRLSRSWVQDVVAGSRAYAAERARLGHKDERDHRYESDFSWSVLVELPDSRVIEVRHSERDLQSFTSGDGQPTNDDLRQEIVLRMGPP
jgi:hypothetical protein